MRRNSLNPLSSYAASLCMSLQTSSLFVHFALFCWKHRVNTWTISEVCRFYFWLHSSQWATHLPSHFPSPSLFPSSYCISWDFAGHPMVYLPDRAHDHFPQWLKRKFWSQSSSNLEVWFLSFAHVLIFPDSLFPTMFPHFAPSPSSRARIMFSR